MPTEDKFLVTNIRRYLGSDNPKLGEDRLIHEISEFSCPKNPDVEWFLKKNAIEFTKKNQSVTYLVFSLSSMKSVGYFTIALKPLTVRGETVSNSVKRKLLRVSELALGMAINDYRTANIRLHNGNLKVYGKYYLQSIHF